MTYKVQHSKKYGKEAPTKEFNNTKEAIDYIGAIIRRPKVIDYSMLDNVTEKNSLILVINDYESILVEAE